MRALRLWWDMFKREKSEKLVTKIAWALPRKLVYWCAIRVMTYKPTTAPDPALIEVLKRWEAAA